MHPKLIRPYSPSKWYDCWRYRIQNGLSKKNTFYNSLKLHQKEQLHQWLGRCFMRSDLLLFDHDNHAMKLEWSLINQNSNSTDKATRFSSLDVNRNEKIRNDSNLNFDSLRFVAKHDLPAGTLLSTELPIGYVNFKLYHDFIQNNQKNGDSNTNYQQMMDSDLGFILQSNADITVNEKYEASLHPRTSLFSPKYSQIEGYNHPMWECVDLIVEFLFTNSVFYHEHIEPLQLHLQESQKIQIQLQFEIDGDTIDDKLIHFTILHAFIERYLYEFNRYPECPNPMPEFSEHPPLRLLQKYPYIPPFFMSDIFRIIHLNGYVNQTLYLRHILGHGLYSMSSYFDHSCDPNAVYCTFNGKLRMVTSKAIKENEPIQTSYLAEFIDQIGMEERRERLNWMGFQCNCTRCQKEMSLIQYEKQAQQRKITCSTTSIKSIEHGVDANETQLETYANYSPDTSVIRDPYFNEDEFYLRRKKKLDEEFLPTIWSELRYLHHVLDEGVFYRWQSRFFRYSSFGNKERMCRWFMRGRIRNGIVWTARDCFKDIECLYPDAALGDLLCKVASDKFKY